MTGNLCIAIVPAFLALALPMPASSSTSPAHRPRHEQDDGKKQEPSKLEGEPRVARKTGDPPPDVDRAVMRALDWLVAHQSPDGSWDCDGFPRQCGQASALTCKGSGNEQHDVSVTGLALLALARAVERGRGEPYQKSLAAGLQWL